MTERSDEKLGILIGEMRGLRNQVTNVEGRLNELDQSFRRALNTKVDWEWARHHDEQAETRNDELDDLRGSRDKFRGALILLTGINAILLVGVGIIGVLIAASP